MKSLIYHCLFLVTLVILVTGQMGSASGQTVQLPSIERFTYSGSLLVPDRGRAYLGGLNSAAGSGGPSHSFQSSQASVNVTIIDLDAIDRQILGGTPEQFLRQQRDQSTSDETRRTPSAVPEREGKSLVRYARSQFSKGNTDTANDAYRMAIAVLSPTLRQLAIKEYKSRFPNSLD